ncbi:MAG: transposase [Deltaproteobacteria bacterium]|nr:transposase [Deltaproteobacteria bacterium]
MSNRFERSAGGFLDLAVSQLKKANTFLEDVDRVVDWRPMEKLLKKKLRRNKDALGTLAYPALSMYKVLLLQRCWDLSDQGMDDALADRISFSRFAGFPFEHDTPDSTTICRFRNALMERGLDEKLFNILGEQLTAKGLIVKQGVIVDASIAESSRRPRKVEVVEESPGSDEEGVAYDVNTTYSEDHEARWTIKAKKPIMASRYTWPPMPSMASSWADTPPRPTERTPRNCWKWSRKRRRPPGPWCLRTKATTAWTTAAHWRRWVSPTASCTGQPRVGN